VTAEYLLFRLREAGETLMALPGRGCFPAGLKSSMPEYLQTPQDEDSHKLDPKRSAEQKLEEGRPRPAPPSAAAISFMDETYEWVRLLPCISDLQRQTRRVVMLRSLAHPLSERADPSV